MWSLSFLFYCRSRVLLLGLHVSHTGVLFHALPLGWVKPGREARTDDVSKVAVYKEVADKPTVGLEHLAISLFVRSIPGSTVLWHGFSG